MLAEREMERLAFGLAGVLESIQLRLDSGSSPSSLLADLAHFADQVTQKCPQISVSTSLPDSGELFSPALSILSSQHLGIRYCALPHGPELPPFVDAILALAHGLNGNRPAWTHELSHLQSRVNLWVFTSATCQHCPQAVRTANTAALTSAFVHTVVIDIDAFPDLVAQYRVRSVPTTIIDGGLTLVGDLDGDELALLLRDSTSLLYSVRLLNSLLEHGRVDEAQAHVLSNDGAAAFGLAWQQSVTSTRIGLLLLSERILAQRPRHFDSEVLSLCDILTSRDVALRGDTADLLGRIGDVAAHEALCALLEDPDADVAEIAQESLDSLRKP